MDMAHLQKEYESFVEGTSKFFCVEQVYHRSLGDVTILHHNQSGTKYIDKVYKRRNVFYEREADIYLSRNMDVTGYLGFIDEGHQIRTLFRFYEAVRITRERDVVDALKRLFNRYVSPLSSAKVSRPIINNNIHAFSSSYVSSCAQERQATIAYLKDLYTFFLSPQFLDVYESLPQAFIHADLKTDNIIATTGGIRIIDWLEARVAPRIREACRTFTRLQKFDNFQGFLTDIEKSTTCVFSREEIAYSLLLVAFEIVRRNARIYLDVNKRAMYPRFAIEGELFIVKNKTEIERRMNNWGITN